MSQRAPIEVTASSWPQLQDALDSLGEPTAGTTRVYRGQPRPYRDEGTRRVSLLPALTRPGSSRGYDPLWYSRLFTALMKGTIPPDLWVHTLWAPALVQHYGPGSSFLDVTSSIDVAFWFALHKRSQRWVRILAGPDPEQLAPHHYLTCWYSRLAPGDSNGSIDESPVLFVFDSQLWSGTDSIRHGSLVCAQSSPWGVAILETATRLNAQKAHLIYSDVEHPEGPDLFGTARAMISLLGLAGWDDVPPVLPASKIFPSPAEDQFYRLLLDTPSRVRFPASRTDPPWLEHPLAIPCYLVNDPPLWEEPGTSLKKGSGDRLDPAQIGLAGNGGAIPIALNELREFVGLSSRLSPVLLFPYLLERLSVAQPEGGILLSDVWYELDKATPFLLESPLWDITPPVPELGGQGYWIESGLPLGVPDIVAGYPTDNIFLEFSTLESWTLEAQFPDHIRGAWIIRSHPHYAITTYGVFEGRLVPITYEFEYRKHDGSFVWQDTRPNETKLARPLTKDYHNAIRQNGLKPLFIGMMMLRDLSRELKPPPFHSFKMDDAFMPAEFLETQIAEAVKEGPFLIPRSLCGAPYVHSPGIPDAKPSGDQQVNRWIDRLKISLQSVKDPYYLSLAGRTLAELYLTQGYRKQASDYIDWASIIATRAQWPSEIALTFTELKARIQCAPP
jgi:hypothetical protein